jgi:phenylalanyl-tRNA synthetase beta chain
MRISLNWLTELVNVNHTPDELADLLTMAGFEVEDIEDRRTWASGVVIGQVLSCQRHPNADKLSVCEVDIGAARPSQIVCGAANIRAEVFVPVATLGTYLPKVDLKIKPAKLRGVASEGMICSLAELGLTKESEGIHIFGAVAESIDIAPGTDVRPLLGLDDVILDVTSTANRADALSMVGLAREIAAITGAALQLPTVVNVTRTPNPDIFQVQVSDFQACPCYIGTLLQAVRIAPSPLWLQRRLQASGIRPINNIVDVTNYVLLEWGQPLHAFDWDRLRSTAGNPTKSPLTLGVRYAEAGESLKTLEGQTRSLQPQNLLITANQQPVALAGVMGGESTEVHAETQNLLLEAAVFDAAVIRRSARAQGLRTEASIRYERGVNWAELPQVCQRAVTLIQELAGGEVLGQETALNRTQAHESPSIELRLERVHQVLGPVEVASPEEDTEEPALVNLPAADVERTLTALGCSLTAAAEGVWQVTVPPYRRRDLEREIDLIEEVARLYGYNAFADTLPNKTEAGYVSLDEEFVRKLRESLRAVGFTELVHYSVVKPERSQQVLIANPLFAEYSALRNDLLTGLIEAFQYNLEQKNGALQGFEIGRIFWQEEDGLQEADSVAGIFGGDASIGRWSRSGQDTPLSWLEAKGLLESVFQRLGLQVEYQPDRRDDRFHPGRTASLWLRGQRLGSFGQLHPQLRGRLCI